MSPEPAIRGFRRHSSRQRRLLAAAAVLAGLLVPAAASAGPLVGMEDERLLLGSPEEAPAAVAAWAGAGVDIVRVHARWGVLEVGREPRYDWTELDRAVGLVHAAGMQVMLTVTGPGPLWTSRAPARHNPRWKPDPRRFAGFARAVAERYGDRVHTYLIWNEPNIAGWLDPQLECRRTPRAQRRAGAPRSLCTPVAPHLYRGLVQAALPEIKRADPGAEVLIGELAPIGRPPRSARSTIPPLTFLRAMACVDERYKRLADRACSGFAPVYADAIGHHPHGVLASPSAPSVDPNWAKMGDLGRLMRVLDRLTAARRMIAPAATGGRFHLHLTEFGYQTSPPDHEIGVTVDQQALWLTEAAHIAWRTPRVRSLVHYQWIDEPVRWRSPALAYAGWQSGLYYVNGTPKPAAYAFVAPLLVDDAGRAWGQVRPGDSHTVTVLRDERPVAVARTDAQGYWTAGVPADPVAKWRFTWEPSGSSRTVRARR